MSINTKRGLGLVGTVIVIIVVIIVVLFIWKSGVVPALWEEVKQTGRDFRDIGNNSTSTTGGVDNSGTLLQIELRSRDNERELGMRTLNLAIERFEKANDAYPTSLAQLVPTYLGELPKDPITGQTFNYARFGPTSYQLWAYLEGDRAPRGDDDLDLSEIGGIDGTLETCPSQNSCIFDYGVAPATE